jgi:hypothetical protein
MTGQRTSERVTIYYTKFEYQRLYLQYLGLDQCLMCFFFFSLLLFFISFFHRLTYPTPEKCCSIAGNYM